MKHLIFAPPPPPFYSLWSMLYPKADALLQECRLDSGGPLLTGLHRAGPLLPPVAESYQPCPLRQILGSRFPQSHLCHSLAFPHAAAQKGQFHPVQHPIAYRESLQRAVANTLSGGNTVPVITCRCSATPLTFRTSQPQDFAHCNQNSLHCHPMSGIQPLCGQKL